MIVAYEVDSERGAETGPERGSEMDSGRKGRLEIAYAGSSTDFGKKITEAVIKGVKAGLELRGE